MLRFRRFDEIDPDERVMVARQPYQLINMPIAQIPIHSAHNNRMVDVVVAADIQSLDGVIEE